MKRFAGNLLAALLGLLFVLLLLEGVLRLLPVNEGMRSQPVNADSPVYHFEPNRVSTWSRHADFRMRNTVRTNNAGFVNEQHYARAATTPLAAVIGDSYVEALMVPYGKTLHGRLARELEGRCRVYSFAASGAPLSQYLAYARLAARDYGADKLVFVIVGNDFDESLERCAQMPGFHYFRETGNGLELVRRDYEPSLAVRLARRSHLALYLLTNVRVQDLAARLGGTFQENGEDVRYAGQTRADADDERLRLGRMAVDAFLAALPQATGLPPERMLFVLDGIRPQLYDPVYVPQADQSFFALMRREFAARAERLGYLVEDLQPRFRRAHAESGDRFEFPDDAHWNARGHALAARAVLESGLLDACR